ncbi:MerR family transcriptional regulator [Pseudoclavibacter endophyticus]|uniref:MerR family transcriptional regulator n=1 Tax=Pseudoclavibacter endophyticus TaxID=1778590 RepID=A0A6H9WLH1_9MICO|nr:MerR family transcriptional regulator [Pseudoclavibacter endophyticus]KAB1649993.1 MerR family transcriptional regulator [Pseudoclavibacter endophyticus]GGA58117.1 MerR family transcriptional regulator [Pseudoclavibacter endophyticus]
MPAAGMMHIGELAERTGLSLRTIRHYDEIGLLTPSGRSQGGFRLYTEGDYERLMLIRRMKPLGYSLEQSADLLRAIDSTAEAVTGDAAAAADARQSLQDFRADAAQRRATLARQLAMADEFLALLADRSGAPPEELPPTAAS